MTNSADQDQLVSEEANWSGSTLFAQAGYIPVQEDHGQHSTNIYVVGTDQKGLSQCF